MMKESPKVSLVGILSHLLRVVFVGVPIAASPFGSYIVGKSTQRIPLIWPPVGSLVIYAVPLASIVIGLVGWVLPKQFSKNVNVKLRTASVCLALVSLFAYSYLVLKYVKEVDTPENGAQYRTIGSERTAAVQKQFPPTTSDVDLLKMGGLDDGSIETMWTPSSVLWVRLRLLVTYVLCLSSVNFAVGTFGGTTALDHKHGSGSGEQP
jgi:hypothetical protein